MLTTVYALYNLAGTAFEAKSLPGFNGESTTRYPILMGRLFATKHRHWPHSLKHLYVVLEKFGLIGMGRSRSALAFGAFLPASAAVALIGISLAPTHYFKLKRSTLYFGDTTTVPYLHHYNHWDSGPILLFPLRPFTRESYACV